MRILVTGPKGYVGSAMVCKLLDRGHNVTALLRHGEALPESGDEGLTWIHASLEEPSSIVELLAHHDGLAHMAASSAPAFESTNERFLRALLDAMSPDQALVMQAGSMTFGDSGESLHSERSPYRPPPPLSQRAKLESYVRALGASDASPRTFIVYAALVYGGLGGTVPGLLMEAAKASGASSYVGDGSQSWSPVHLEDWVELMALALERGPRGGKAYFAAGESAVSMAEMARLVSAATAAPVRAIGIEEATQRYGFFGPALASRQCLDSTGARSDLGWRPEQNSIADWFHLRWPRRHLSH